MDGEELPLSFVLPWFHQKTSKRETHWKSRDKTSFLTWESGGNLRSWTANPLFNLVSASRKRREMSGSLDGLQFLESPKRQHIYINTTVHIVLAFLGLTLHNAPAQECLKFALPFVSVKINALILEIKLSQELPKCANPISLNLKCHKIKPS